MPRTRPCTAPVLSSTGSKVGTSGALDRRFTRRGSIDFTGRPTVSMARFPTTATRHAVWTTRTTVTRRTKAIAQVPGALQEWCFQRFCVTNTFGGTQSGPTAKIYCVAGASAGIFVTSDRNGNANFRVWNFSGSDIVNVQLRTDPPPGSSMCSFGTVANNSASGPCPVALGGPGYLTLWYNNGWVAQDTIDFDQ